MHKQTANWYFSKSKPVLSSDRINRVKEKQSFFSIFFYHIHYISVIREINNIFFCFYISHNELACSQSYNDSNGISLNEWAEKSLKVLFMCKAISIWIYLCKSLTYPVYWADIPTITSLIVWIIWT
jgi:hypothetical protein